MRVLGMFALLALSSCEQKPVLHVDDAWVRLGASPTLPAAGYAVVHGGPEPTRLTDVSSPAVIRVEMHETMNDKHLSNMRPIVAVDVPARGTVKFAPGGKHLMLFNINPGLAPPRTLPLIFTFANGERIQADATLIRAGDPAPESFMTSRSLTGDEVALARSIFGDAIDYGPVRINRRKWAFFQPRETAMSPDGDIWFHPGGSLYCDDFCARSVDAQGLFIHEMTHVWQRQKGIYLPLMRHPFCRYDYSLRPGWRLERYGLEQQAEIVRHAFLIREGHRVPGAPPLDQYRELLTF